MPFGSDPQLLALSSNLHALTTRLETLERVVNSFQYSLDAITGKLDAQTEMLKNLLKAESLNKTD